MNTDFKKHVRKWGSIILILWVLAACHPVVLRGMTTPGVATRPGISATPEASITLLEALTPSPKLRSTQPPRLDLTPAPLLALVNGTLIDGTGGEPIRDAVLVIRDGRIQAVGPRRQVTIPAEAQVINVEGATILPGFMNTHVHSGYNLENLKAWALAGVTTVRDLATSLPVPFARRDQANQDARYARLVVVGSMITVQDGYPIQPWGIQSVTVSTPEEARQAVNEMLDQGADLIKIPLESGKIFQRRLPTLTDEEVIAIVETAHQRDTRVSVHVTIADDLKRAIDDGADDIAHMITDPLPYELIQRVVAANIYWEPTLELWMGVGQGLQAHVIDNLRRFVEAGGNVALGTDFDGYTTPFELGMPTKEIQWMGEAGMTPMQIILAATRNAAHVCNIEKDLGTLETGKIADVLVVQGDPLQDIQTLSNVAWVIHNGVIIRSPGQEP